MPTEQLHSTWHWYYIILSYIISSIGSLTSMILMSHRTGRKGKWNWVSN